MKGNWRAISLENREAKYPIQACVKQIIYQDRVSLHNSRKDINHINVLNCHNHIIITTDAEKDFGKPNIPSYDERLRESNIWGNMLQYSKSYLWQTHLQSIPGKKMWSNPIKIRSETGRSWIHTLYNIVCEKDIIETHFSEFLKMKTNKQKLKMNQGLERPLQRKL